MNRSINAVTRALLLAGLAASTLIGFSGPFDGKNFKGRIAYSADGNHNDEDDWAASPVALAIFDGFGVKDKLVHFDYNSILPGTDSEWEKIHETSVLGAVERYGYDPSRFFNDRKDLDGAVESIRQAIDASSADDPLFFIVAGPMEVPYRGIQASDPGKRKFVYVISHSRWNDGFDTDYQYRHNKRSVIPSGVTWVQIADQNRFLSTSRYGRAATDDEWVPWLWMRDSDDSKVRFLWERMTVTTRADCSDAGMAYFLMTGDEVGDPPKLKRLLDGNVVPEPNDPRGRIRIEAENFLSLEGFELHYENDRAVSHRIDVRLAGGASGSIRTAFHQPYAAEAGVYDIEVRYFDQKAGQSGLELQVNGVRQGEVWRAAEDDDAWQVHRIPAVHLNEGDQIAVKARGDGAEGIRLDYVELVLNLAR